MLVFEVSCASASQRRGGLLSTRARLSRDNSHTKRRVSWVLPGIVALLSAQSAVGGPLEDLRPGHWAAVSLNTLADVDPCPARECSYSGNEGQAGVVDDWTGGVFASQLGAQGGYVVWGGGHGGYLGNEIYVFDLATLRWERYSEPVQEPTCNHDRGELQDGSPCARHTYDYVDYHPPSNSFVSLGSASDHDCGGCGTPAVHLFDLTARSWRRGGDRFAGFQGFTGASSAYDAERDVFWVWPAYNQPFSKYDPAAGMWTQYENTPINIDAVSSIDPSRDLFVTVDARDDSVNAHRVLVRDLRNPRQAPVAVRTSGDRAVEFKSAAGFEWDPKLSKFVAWIGGTSVYTLAAPQGDWKRGTWSWTKVAAAATNAVTPTAPNANGTYSRWRYVPALDVYLVVNRVGDPVFALKVDAEAAGDSAAR